MTVFNDLRFLDQAVNSVLQQDFRDFELIIVDDGTGEEARFRALQQRDPRIRVVVNPTNLGTAAAANRGIAEARADIIARLDADDVAEPKRLGRLVAALAEDPHLGLVGSWCRTIDENGRLKGMHRTPPTDPEIRWTILFHSPFIHSTVAYRRACFEAAGHYRPEELVSQDHYLWFQMLPFCRACNIPEPLARYRRNRRGLSATNSRNARNRTHPIREKLWAELGLTYDLHDDVLARHVSDFLRGRDIAPAERRIAAYRVILTVLRAFLAASRPFARDEDALVTRKMTKGIINRMLASPPGRLVDAVALGWYCWPIAKKAAIAAALRHVPRARRTAEAERRHA
jgi:glycosyltransferase involved in cell wall biosynthesis